MRPRRTRPRPAASARPSRLGGLVGIVVVVVAWELLARAGVAGRSLPAPTEVLVLVSEPAKRSLLWRASLATVRSATIGVVLAALLGAALAFAGVLARSAAVGFERFATAVQALPSIAFAPILIITAGPAVTPVAIAVLTGFFPVYVALRGGFGTVPRAYADLAHVFGAPRRVALRRFMLPHVVPDLIDGLRLSTPAALLGAVIGEWFGAPRGLGVVIITSMQSFAIPQLWAAALAGCLLSLAVYAVLSLAHAWSARRFVL